MQIRNEAILMNYIGIEILLGARPASQPGGHMIWEQKYDHLSTSYALRLYHSIRPYHPRLSILLNGKLRYERKMEIREFIIWYGTLTSAVRIEFSTRQEIVVTNTHTHTQTLLFFFFLICTDVLTFCNSLTFVAS